MLAGLETPPPAVLAQSIRLAGSAHRFKTAAVGQVSLVQVVDTSVPVGVAAQAAALAEEVRQAQWLLGEHPWDMSIVIDDGWEAPPTPEPVAETGDEAAEEGEGAAEEEAAPEPAPPAVGPPGPGAELAAAVTELLGSGSEACGGCTWAWGAPEPPDGEEGEGQTAWPAARRTRPNCQERKLATERSIATAGTSIGGAPAEEAGEGGDGEGIPATSGKKDEKVSDSKEFSRTQFMCIDSGTLIANGSKDPKKWNEGCKKQLEGSQKEQNFEIKEILSQSSMRYNQLFSTKISVTIPGEFSLRAGDSIFFDGPELTGDAKKDEVDEKDGGLYILSLINI